MNRAVVAASFAIALVMAATLGNATASMGGQATTRVTFVRVAVPDYLSDSGDPEFGVDVCFKGVTDIDTIPQFIGSARVAHAFARNKSKQIHRVTRSVSFDLATDVGSSIDTDSYTLDVDALDADNCFLHLRLGNPFVLPPGVQRGTLTITVLDQTAAILGTAKYAYTVHYAHGELFRDDSAGFDSCFLNDNSTVFDAGPHTWCQLPDNVTYAIRRVYGG